MKKIASKVYEALLSGTFRKLSEKEQDATGYDKGYVGEVEGLFIYATFGPGGVALDAYKMKPTLKKASYMPTWSTFMSIGPVVRPK
jgi:hypothetical protein